MTQARIRIGGELGAGSELGDPPVVEDQDLIGAFHRREAVGDDDRGPILEQSIRHPRQDPVAGGTLKLVSYLEPQQVAPGEQAHLRVLLTNNKTGHDFPTGPLDMIESWIELTVVDEQGNIVHHSGGVDEATDQVVNSQVLFKADGFDRKGELIDRHNLWDLVGASYKRSLYPGVTDSFEAELVCPSMARGRLDIDTREAPGTRVDEFAVTAAEPGTLKVRAVLWYRKANPEFLDRVYGAEQDIRSPVTAISEAEATIRVQDVQAANQ